MNNDIITKIYKRTAVVSFIIMGVIFFTFENPKPIVLGYVFGLIISMLSFKLLDNTINKAVKMTPGKANSYTFRHYILRYIIYFIVLLVAVEADYLNLLATLFGLLMVKFTIVVSAIVDKNFTKS